LDWGIRLIVEMQQAAPWLRAPMRFFALLGEESFMFLWVPMLYWCVDARLGIRIGVLLTLSNSFKVFFKLAFHQPRPYWISEQVIAMDRAPSYGVPSGHAQDAAVLWGVIGASREASKTWLRWLLVAVIFLIGLSRIFSAVHFPTDVLAGWLIGGAILWAFLKWERPLLAWFKRHTLMQQMGLVLAASLVLLAIALAGLVFVPPADPPEWAVHAARVAGKGEPAIDPRNVTVMSTVTASSFGFAVGVLLLFHQGGFDARTEWWKRIARLVIGLIGTLVIWQGLAMVFPRDTTIASQALRYLRYSLAGFWIGYGAPWAFIRLKL
jgi:membrane-associated phospholipid phosphatase